MCSAASQKFHLDKQPAEHRAYREIRHQILSLLEGSDMGGKHACHATCLLAGTIMERREAASSPATYSPSRRLIRDGIALLRMALLLDNAICAVSAEDEC